MNRSTWPSAAGVVVRRPGDEGAGLLTKLRAVSVAGLWGFAVYALYTYLGTGLRDAGLSTGSVAVALVLFGVGAVIGSLGGGRLADRHGPGRIATLSLVLLAVMQLSVDLVLRGPTALLFVVLGLFALTAYACIPSYQSRLVARFPTQSGSFLAWTNSALYLGTSAGSAAGGALLSTAGFRAIPLVGAAAGLLGALACAFWAVPRSRASVESTAGARPARDLAPQPGHGAE
jgi:predicted MFS family arabinose efflux permease